MRLFLCDYGISASLLFLCDYGISASRLFLCDYGISASRLFLCVYGISASRLFLFDYGISASRLFLCDYGISASRLFLFDHGIWMNLKVLKLNSTVHTVTRLYNRILKVFIHLIWSCNRKYSNVEGRFFVSPTFILIVIMKS